MRMNYFDVLYLPEGLFSLFLLQIQTLTDAIAVTATTNRVNKSKSSFVRTESTTHGTRAIQATHRYKWNVLDLSIIVFFFRFLGRARAAWKQQHWRPLATHLRTNIIFSLLLFSTLLGQHLPLNISHTVVDNSADMCSTGYGFCLLIDFIWFPSSSSCRCNIFVFIFRLPFVESLVCRLQLWLCECSRVASPKLTKHSKTWNVNAVLGLFSTVYTDYGTCVYTPLPLSLCILHTTTTIKAYCVSMCEMSSARLFWF